MGFIWAGARALRRTHLGRFAKLRSDTAWLEGTLFEADNPGQTGDCPPLVVFIAHFLHNLSSCIAPKRLKPSDGTVAEDSKASGVKAEPDGSAIADGSALAAAATPATPATPAEAAPAAETVPEIADSDLSTTMQ